MKKLATLLLMLCATLTAMTQGLFDKLDYRDGVATLQIHARLTDIGMYEPRGEIDTIEHEFPPSAVAFDYHHEGYYIAINDHLDLREIEFIDSVRMAITVWRDRKDIYGESPYAEVTAIERLRAEGEVDTLGRFLCYNGDTIVFTNEDARWEWRSFRNLHIGCSLPDDNIRYYVLLYLNDAFCQKMRVTLWRYVEYYDRGNHRWFVRYKPYHPDMQPSSVPSNPPCEIQLMEE